MTEAPSNVISFGKAGQLCVGVDAEIRQGCEAILSTYDRFVKGSRRRVDVDTYGRACDTIEARAKAIARIAATSPAGVRAKAQVVARLAPIGMAMGAVRIMAASLARDVLALEKGP